MIEAGLALVCALVAWSAAAALTVRCYRGPRLYKLAWLAAATALMVALTASLPASVLGYSGGTFRLLHIGAALLAPLWASWGAVEFAARSSTTRLLMREAVALLTVVPLAILALDPVSGDFATTLPAFSEHYQLPAMTALGLVHVFCVVVLAACAGVLVHRFRLGSGLALSRLPAVGLAGGAVLAEILATRVGWGVAGQLLLLAAVVCLWQASGQASGLPTAAEEDEEGFEDPEVEDDDREDAPMRRRREGTVPHPAPERPYAGRLARGKSAITIYTLHEGHADAFDARMAELVGAVRQYEPETLLFVSHKVAAASSQRILYAMYRDALAFEQHEQQPHKLEFSRDAAPHIAATNTIELDPTGGSADEALLSAFALR